MTFVVGMWVASLAVVLSALLCPGRQVVTRSSPPPPPLFGWLGLSPGPKWHRARCGWGDPVVHGQGSWLNFTQVLNFPQPPHFTFTFHTSSCCHHPALLPDHGMHHGISSPPRPALLGESTLCWYFPPNPSPLQFTFTWGTCGCLFWWAEASLGAASYGDFFIVMQRLISLSCARTEQIDCKYYFVMVILHEHWSRPKKTLAF